MLLHSYMKLKHVNVFIVTKLNINKCTIYYSTSKSYWKGHKNSKI